MVVRAVAVQTFKLGPNGRPVLTSDDTGAGHPYRDTLRSPPSSSSLDHLLLATAVSFALSLSVPHKLEHQVLQHTSPRSMSSRSPSDFASFHEIRIAAACPLYQDNLKELRMVYELINPATQDLRKTRRCLTENIGWKWQLLTVAPNVVSYRDNT
ncbi:hypothetical protein CPC08DRAFT_767915 [Agrocybe pediades]|nr:hypothetical protein CPC08DRAFT_767915 [Agrocybe pediades]